MHHSLFGELSIIIGITVLVASVMRLLKQPLLISYILAGILAGPIFGIVKNAETLEGFSKIGIALLLFIVGLGLNPKVIKDLGKVAFITGTVQVTASAIFGTIVMMLLGKGLVTGLIVGVALAFSSTIVGLKLLTDKREQTRLYGKMAIGVLLVQDILATVALLVLSMQKDGFSLLGGAGLIVKGALIAVPLFFISNKVLPRYTRFIAENTEYLFLFTIAWGLGIASLFELGGFSLEIGALIAGVSLAGMPYAQEASSRLRPVRDFFIVMFFIVMGANLAIGDIISQLPLALLFSTVVLLMNPLAIMLPLGFLGHAKRNSFKVGIMMAQVSEFSLIFVILAQQIGIVDSEVVSLITITALITIAVSCYAILYDDTLFDFLQKRFKFFESRRQDKKERRTSYDIVQFGYSKGGSELIKTYESMPRKKLVVVDYDPEAIERLEARQIHYVYGDATDIELLDELQLQDAKLIVSFITHFPTNRFLIEYIEKLNEDSVIITRADTAEEAAELYGLGASYVMVPHFVGSERLGNFIARHGLSKKDFNKNKEKHLNHLRNTYEIKDIDGETTE
ncbi:cation:proton antiporter [Candidatus Saccharibacteria bacterium]|nr:cation:proton antiporter [Candidatus Saccharibacteria bacterium]